MRRRSVLFAVIAVSGLACASAGNKLASREACTISARDSEFVGFRPLYRDCAVDQVARFVSTDAHPNFRPDSRAPTCYSADLEFVVDSLGKPEVGTARLVRTSYEPFARAVLETLQAWEYQPAVRDGKTVRQIVTAHQTAATMSVVVPAGSGPPSRPPSQRPPTC
jgi:hypothetical protein